MTTASKNSGASGFTRTQGKMVTAMLSLLLIILAGYMQSAEGATITANGTTCTLIEAINSANEDNSDGDCTEGSGADTIELTTDVSLTESDNSTKGENGLPIIESDITINGNGHVIERAETAREDFRIFYVRLGGDLKLNNVTVRNGRATAVVSDGTNGGGIHSDGNLTITDSTVSNNHADNDGGGIYSDNDELIAVTLLSDNLTVTNSTVSNNTAEDGGGIYNNDGDATITGSTISNNTARDEGGGIHNDDDDMEIRDSTISNNHADDDGGGIYNDDDDVDVINSTLSGNSAGDEGGGIYHESGDDLIISNSTLFGNSADYGGGLYTETYRVDIINSIITNSSPDDCDGDEPDRMVNNRFDDSSCNGSNPVTNLDPVLRDNGGPTMTHALLPGSNAIDAADNEEGECAGSGSGLDQRGETRGVDGDGSPNSPETGDCDIGAYEFQPLPPQALNEPGSLLVWPLVDNINHTTIINIANTGNKSVRLECYAVTKGPDGGADQKIDWIINESPKEKFWWNTAVGRTHTNVDGNLTKIPSLANRSGYIFCFAVGKTIQPCTDCPPAPVTSGGYNDTSRMEKAYNYMKGDATLFDGTRAFNYNAIPSQARSIKPDRILDLDGLEYTMATSQIMIEGFAQGAFGLIDGKIAAVNIGIDFIKSEQPEFDINVWCWNEDEVPFSVHLHYKDWEHYTLTDWNATRFNLGTDAFHCATTSTHAIWAVLYETAGNMAFGGNVWQHPETKVPTKVKLPEVPMSN